MSNTKTIKPLAIKVSYDHIPSINSAYMPVRGRLMLSNEARAYKQTILQCLEGFKDIDFTKRHPWLLDEGLWLQLEIHFLFNQSFEIRDVDNPIKLTVDALHQWLEIDDRYNLSVTSKKFFIPDSPKEYVILICQPCTMDYMAYHKKWIEELNKEGLKSNDEY